MLTYDDVRMMWQDYVRLGIGRVDEDKLLDLLSECMALYERCGEDLLKTNSILDVVEVLKQEKEVSRCLSEEVDELTEKLEAAERTIAELRQRLNESESTT